MPAEPGTLGIALLAADRRDEALMQFELARQVDGAADHVAHAWNFMPCGKSPDLA